MQPFLAMIVPMGDTGGGQPQPPLGIWGPSDPRPTNPIVGPGRRPGWGMANDPSYGVPLPPLVIWGPGDPRPTPPIAGPGRPPGWGIANDPGYGIEAGPPLGMWGPNDPRPTPPIAEPPWGWGGKPPEIDLPPEIPDGPKVEWKYAWTPMTGWIVVGIPQGPVVTPSK